MLEYNIDVVLSAVSEQKLLGYIYTPLVLPHKRYILYSIDGLLFHKYKLLKILSTKNIYLEIKFSKRNQVDYDGG